MIVYKFYFFKTENYEQLGISHIRNHFLTTHWFIIIFLIYESLRGKSQNYSTSHKKRGINQKLLIMLGW